MEAGTSADRRIISHLRDRVAAGDRYFRSKRIAAAVGLSAKQVGVRMPHLGERTVDLEISAWGRSRSTTWHVTPR